MKKLSILFLTLLLAFQPLMSLAVGPPLARFSALPGDMQQFLPEGYDFIDGIGTSWALVELMDGQTLISGFVPENALMVKPSLSLVPASPFSDTGEFAQYQAMAVVQRAPNGDIAGISVYALLPQAWKCPAAGVDALVGYRLYEGNRASYQLMGWQDHQGLCVFRHDEGFATQADVLGLVPIYALSGEVAEESLMIPLK